MGKGITQSSSTPIQGGGQTATSPAPQPQAPQTPQAGMGGKGLGAQKPNPMQGGVGLGGYAQPLPFPQTQSNMAAQQQALMQYQNQMRGQTANPFPAMQQPPQQTPSPVQGGVGLGGYAQPLPQQTPSPVQGGAPGLGAFSQPQPAAPINPAPAVRPDAHQQFMNRFGERRIGGAPYEHQVARPDDRQMYQRLLQRTPFDRD